MQKKAQIKNYNKPAFHKMDQLQGSNKLKDQLSFITNTRTITINHSLFINIRMFQNNKNKQTFRINLHFQEKDFKIINKKIKTLNRNLMYHIQYQIQHFPITCLLKLHKNLFKMEMDQEHILKLETILIFMMKKTMKSLNEEIPFQQK